MTDIDFWQRHGGLQHFGKEKSYPNYNNYKAIDKIIRRINNDISYIIANFDECDIIEKSNFIFSLIAKLRELKEFKIDNREYYDILFVLIECLKIIDSGNFSVEQLKAIKNILYFYDIAEIAFDQVIKANLYLKQYFNLML